MTNPTGYTALDLIGYTDKGDYSSIETYVKNDLTNYNGIKWRCLIDDTTDVTPTEGLNWTKFIEYGDYVKEVDYEEDIYGVETPNPQSIQNQITDQTNVLGAKNLFINTAATETKNGITLTANSDGTLKVNGTATAEAIFNIMGTSPNPLSSPWQDSIKGYDLRLTGCPSDGANDKYFIGLVKNDGTESRYRDYGEGVTFNYTAGTYKAYITVRNGVTINNKVFKPMICLASDPDDTYVPYAMTNRELTDYINEKKNHTDEPVRIARANGNQTYGAQLTSLYSTYQNLTNAQKARTTVCTNGYVNGNYRVSAPAVGAFGMVSATNNGVMELFALRLSTPLFIKTSISSTGAVTREDYTNNTNSNPIDLYYI